MQLVLLRVPQQRQYSQQYTEELQQEYFHHYNQQVLQVSVKLQILYLVVREPMPEVTFVVQIFLLSLQFRIQSQKNPSQQIQTKNYQYLFALKLANVNT